MHFYGGPEWEAWNKGTKDKAGMRDTLIQGQDTGQDKAHVHQKGSWSSDGHPQTSGRLMVTSMSLLTLEVYYRHLPLYGRGQGGLKELDMGN